MQEANFSNTSIIEQKSLNTSTPNMHAPHKLLDNKEFSVMLPKATNKKALLDSIATLKSSYVMFHSKMLQRSQSYEELSNSSQIEERKKDNEMIAETRSLNEKSAQPGGQKTSIKVPEGPKEDNESILKEKGKSGSQLPEREVSVLIQNSGLIKREISMINQDETLKNFIDELEFSQKESVQNDEQEPSVEEDAKPRIEESRKSSNKTSSLKSSAKEISNESVRSVAESQKSFEEKPSGAPFWKRINKLSIVLNLLLISMFFMAQKIKFSQLFTGNELNQKEIFLETGMILKEQSFTEKKNETVVAVEVVKNVMEYREYQDLVVEKEKLLQENGNLRMKTKDLETKIAELNDNFNALKSTHFETLIRISNAMGKLQKGKDTMDRAGPLHTEIAVKCSGMLRIIGAELLGEK